MKKKVLVGLLVLALAVAGLSAKDLGIKVGGELGWGIDIGRLKIMDEDDGDLMYKAINNGFAANLTGEYDFNENWGVKATFGMMFAGKTKMIISAEGTTHSEKVKKNAGLYIDAAVDAKYTYAINDKISVSGLAGFELVSGCLTRSLEFNMATLGTLSEEEIADKMKNTAFGINLAAEGAYKITDDISVTGGVNFAWFFVNNAKFLDTMKQAGEKFSGATTFYIRPYVGATYSF